MRNERMIRMLLTAGLIVLAVIMAVYSWDTLPNIVATQPAAFQTGAPSVHKLVAVALPTMFIGVFTYLGNRETKLFLGSLIGIAMHIAFWISN